MRLNQYIAESGRCSRREADQLIADGRVTINGKTATLGAQVEEGDFVKIGGRPIFSKRKPDTDRKSDRVVLLVNKPVGVTSTTDKSDETNIIDFINYPVRLFTIGRLDKDSEGAILLTNDGTIVNALLRSENEHNKTYVVQVDKDVTDGFIQKMASGVRIFNPVSNKHVTTKPCKVKKLSAKSFEIILTQGYNRQIRRMCEAQSYNVTSLVRIKFLFLTIKNLKPGRWRKLTDTELAQLDKLASK